MTNDPRVALRAAAFTGDGPGVVAALSSHTWDDQLQFAGDSLLLAVAQRVETAGELARRCAAQLRDRGWEGDRDLADLLDAALGERPTPMLRPLPVDLDELAEILEGDPANGGGRIDLHTGEVWPQPAIDYALEAEDDDLDDEPDRWLEVWCQGSRRGYQDMEDFIQTVADEARADRLSIAISGRGAFRRFKDVLARWPGELERWYLFSNERRRGRARVWLAGAGYTATVRRVAPSS